MPEGYRQQPPEQVEVEHLDHHGAGDDGQWRDVGAEPQGEEIAGLPVALCEWNVVDRVVLDQRVLPGHLGHVHELEFVCSYLCMKPNRGDSLAAPQMRTILWYSKL
ncbi:hypothetical protein D9M71_385770 [compost metagenome]